MIRGVLILLCLATPALAQEIDVNRAVAPFQEQRNSALDAAAFCSINLKLAQAALKENREKANKEATDAAATAAAEIAELKKKLAEAEAKVPKAE